MTKLNNANRSLIRLEDDNFCLFFGGRPFPTLTSIFIHHTAEINDGTVGSSPSHVLVVSLLRMAGSLRKLHLQTQY